jgi:hypothetical protein
MRNSPIMDEIWEIHDVNYQDDYRSMLSYDSLICDVNGLPKLNLKQITQFEEPWRKLLYAYYGYIAPLDNYTNEELIQQGNNYANHANVYFIAIVKKNLKLIKYLHLRNVNYNFVLFVYNNLYIMAIQRGYLKIIKYFDSNNYIFNNTIRFLPNNMTLMSLKAAGHSGHLRMIKYFESKICSKIDIINCYMAAVCSKKAKIRVLKYLESKYPLYIKSNIKYYANILAIDYRRNKKIKYLNKNNKYLNNKAQQLLILNIKFIKYVYSKIPELKLSYLKYYEIYSERNYVKSPFKQISNYFIRYRAKYMLCYI